MTSAAAAVGTTCALALGEVGTRLVELESARLVVGRQGPDSRAPLRIYAVTGEGRRKAGITVVR